MGCCNSKPDTNVQEQPHESENVNTQVPPIVITKAQSVTSTESLLASTSANAMSTQSDEQQEKPPAKIEEQRGHEDIEPPAFEEETATQKATIVDTKPVVISPPQPTTTIIPETDTKYTNTASPTLPSNMTTTDDNTQTLWTILVRISSSAKDVAVNIPTAAPFMTVADLKQKILIESDQQIKLIHLGRILQDSFTLVPSTTEITNKTDTIKVSNLGVIQAMIYKL